MSGGDNDLMQVSGNTTEIGSKTKIDSKYLEEELIKLRNMCRELGELQKSDIKPNHVSNPGPSGNACGAIYAMTLPAPAGAAKDPQDSAQTKEESAWDQFKQGAKDGAQYYKDNVSQSLHDFAGSAMETGGTVATVGEGTMLAGAGVAATGVGAPVAAGMEVVGGATTVVGGGVAAVGGISEGAATLLDKAADMIITGKTPDLLGVALQLGETLLARLVTSRVPASGLGGKKPPAKPKKDNEKKPKSDKADGSGGGYVLGVGGPCIVGTYDEIKKKCGEGQQAHHIVPDTLARTSNRADGMKGIGRIPGMPSFGGGPSICLQGQAGTEGSEHNTAHQCDSEIQGVACAMEGDLYKTITVKDGVKIAMHHAIAARPDCKEQIEAEVRKAYPNHENDNRSMNGAGRPAEGKAKEHLESGGKSTESKQVGGRKGKFK